MTSMRILHVEIGPLTGSRSRSMRLRNRGHAEAGSPDNDREMSTTMDALTRLLSERNIALLQMIRDRRPRSVAELARMSGRPKASLTLTLRRLEKFGMVAFKDVEGRRKVPTVVCDRLLLELEIRPAAEALSGRVES